MFLPQFGPQAHTCYIRFILTVGIVGMPTVYSIAVGACLGSIKARQLSQARSMLPRPGRTHKHCGQTKVGQLGRLIRLQRYLWRDYLTSRMYGAEASALDLDSGAPAWMPPGAPRACWAGSNAWAKCGASTRPGAVAKPWLGWAPRSVRLPCSHLCAGRSSRTGSVGMLLPTCTKSWDYQGWSLTQVASDSPGHSWQHVKQHLLCEKYD